MENMERKTEALFIRCDKETAKKFKIFVVSYGFKCYGDALRHLLKIAETYGKFPKGL